MPRTALENRLVNLLFQSLDEIGVGIERSQERSSARQVAFRLCNSRLFRQGVDIVRRDVENLIKLPQRFWKAAKCGIVKRSASLKYDSLCSHWSCLRAT